MSEDDDALNVWLVGCWCWVLVSTVGDVSRLVVLSSLCPGQSWHLQLSWSQHTGGGRRLSSQRCPGPRQHHLLRFGPDAVDHACCSNRHILDCLSSLLSPLSSLSTTSMYSLQWREREVVRMSRLVQSLVLSVLTHTPLHSTQVYSSLLQPYYMGATTVELHARAGRAPLQSSLIMQTL